MNATAPGQRITRVALAILGLVLVVGVIIVAAALSSRPTAPTASISVHLQPDWHGKWKTGEPGVKFIPPSVTPPRRVVASFARDIESPALAKEAILRLGLRMTPDELLGNLTTEPEPESAFAIRLTYRDPASETPQRARRIVRTVAVEAHGRFRKETPYDYDWVL